MYYIMDTYISGHSYFQTTKQKGHSENIVDKKEFPSFFGNQILVSRKVEKLFR